MLDFRGIVFLCAVVAGCGPAFLVLDSPQQAAAQDASDPGNASRVKAEASLKDQQHLTLARGLNFRLEYFQQIQSSSKPALVSGHQISFPEMIRYCAAQEGSIVWSEVYLESQVVGAVYRYSILTSANQRIFRGGPFQAILDPASQLWTIPLSSFLSGHGGGGVQKSVSDTHELTLDLSLKNQKHFQFKIFFKIYGLPKSA
jgi:hypothetical protein